jgi:uncharacterized protein (DUF924 family)
MTGYDDVLAFWLAEGRDDDWFSGEAAFDRLCSGFGDTVENAIGGAFADWPDEPRGALALCLLLDQLPRNLFRGTARAFAGDMRARSVAAAAVGERFDLALPDRERLFLYMPFEHSEDLADQRRGVAMIATLGDPRLLGHAQRHREVIARFGRFPHRNAILDRPSTADEVAFRFVVLGVVSRLVWAAARWSRAGPRPHCDTPDRRRPARIRRAAPGSCGARFRTTRSAARRSPGSVRRGGPSRNGRRDRFATPGDACLSPLINPDVRRYGAIGGAAVARVGPRPRRTPVPYSRGAVERPPTCSPS